MSKIINKIIFFFKCTYNLYIFIFFKGLIGKQLIYNQVDKSSNRNLSTSNDALELIKQTDNSILIVPVKDKNNDKTQTMLSNNQPRERKVI